VPLAGSGSAAGRRACGNCHCTPEQDRHITQAGPLHHAKCERALRQTRGPCACSFPASTRHRSTRPPRPERRLGAAFAGSRLRPISSVRLPRSARSLLSSRRLTSHDRVGDIAIAPIPLRANRSALLVSPQMQADESGPPSGPPGTIGRCSSAPRVTCAFRREVRRLASVLKRASCRF
jgi:hypothetical protein